MSKPFGQSRDVVVRENIHHFLALKRRDELHQSVATILGSVGSCSRNGSSVPTVPAASLQPCL